MILLVAPPIVAFEPVGQFQLNIMVGCCLQREQVLTHFVKNRDRPHRDSHQTKSSVIEVHV